MGKFSRKVISQQAIPADDQGVDVQEVIELAQSNRFYEQLAALLNIDEIAGEFINIKGARTLVRSLKKEDKKFEKFDLQSDYHDLEFFYADDRELYISFKDIRDEKVLLITGNTEFTCLPEYSSKSDFFKSLFTMQSFASDLTDKGFSKFVKDTLYSLRGLIPRGKHMRFYRVLKDNSEEDKYYLRASISERYNDYSDNIAVLLGLIGLHQQSQKNGTNFYIQEFSYSESFVNVSFAKEENKIIEGVGEVKYVIDVSNDEIKREALKFTSSITIIYGENENNKKELFIKPFDAKWNLLSISHRAKPTTVIKELGDIGSYINKEAEIYKSLEEISKIKDLNAVRHLVYRVIDGSKNLVPDAKKQYLLAELNSNVNTLYQFFDALNKVEYLVEDIEAKEYLRYLFYDALVYGRPRKSRSTNNDGNV
jgi:hypothetical protein